MQINRRSIWKLYTEADNKTGLILHHPVIYCTVIMLLHATQKIVAMEFAKATDNYEVWLFDNLSSCIFNKKNSRLRIFVREFCSTPAHCISMYYMYVVFKFFI